VIGPGELGLRFWLGNRVLGFHRKWELGKESRTKVEVGGRKRMVGMELRMPTNSYACYQYLYTSAYLIAYSCISNYFSNMSV
jgi:hypothetical protein